jgi:hypothetical protein
MKKFILNAVFALFTAAAAQAQIGTGFFAGGSLGLSMGDLRYHQNGSSITEGPRTLSFHINPRIGYFFTDNFAAGLLLGYGGSSSNSKGAVEVKTSTTELSVGLFGRYAMGVGDESKFFFTGDLNLGFNSQTGKTETGSLSVDNDPVMVISAGIAPGILYFPTPKIGLEAGLGNIFSVNVNTETDAGNADNKTVYTSINIFDINTLGFNFGMNYYFNR